MFKVVTEMGFSQKEFGIIVPWLIMLKSFVILLGLMDDEARSGTVCPHIHKLQLLMGVTLYKHNTSSSPLLSGIAYFVLGI